MRQMIKNGTSACDTAIVINTNASQMKLEQIIQNIAHIIHSEPFRRLLDINE